METFAVVNTNVIYNKAISSMAFRLFCSLVQKCYGQKNTCFPSQKRLAEELQVCVRTIQRCLKQLTAQGLITIQHRLGTSNIYTILHKIKLQVQQKKNDFISYAKNAYRKNYGRASNERQYDAEELEKALLERDNNNHPE